MLALDFCSFSSSFVSFCFYCTLDCNKDIFSCKFDFSSRLLSNFLFISSSDFFNNFSILFLYRSCSFNCFSNDSLSFNRSSTLSCELSKFLSFLLLIFLECLLLYTASILFWNCDLFWLYSTYSIAIIDFFWSIWGGLMLLTAFFGDYVFYIFFISF